MSLTINLEAGGLRGYREEDGTPDGRLSFTKRLGKGAEGSVYLAVPVNLPTLPSLRSDRSQRASRHVFPVAVKVVTGDAFQRYRQTRCLWPSLVHPNIVFPRKSIFDEKKSRCFVEMELCETDLLDLVMRDGPLSDNRASMLAGHLALALAHCHGQGIAHQDVKLENVFILDDVAKLGDIGSIIKVLPEGPTGASLGDEEIAASTKDPTLEAISPSSRRPGAFHSSSPSPFPCSTIYAPPEAFENATLGNLPYASHESVVHPGQKDPRRHPSNPFASDMWSLGIVLYAAVAKCHPWERACRSDRKFERYVQEGSSEFFPSSFCAGLKTLLSKLLCVDPAKRATAIEVLDFPWVLLCATVPPLSGKKLMETNDICATWPRVSPAPVTPSDYATDTTDIDSSSEPGSPAPIDPTPIPIYSLSTAKLPTDGTCKACGPICRAKAPVRRPPRSEPFTAGLICAEMSAEASRNNSEAELSLDGVAKQSPGRASKEIQVSTPSPVDTNDLAARFTSWGNDLPHFIAAPPRGPGMKRPVPTSFGTRGAEQVGSKEPGNRKFKKAMISDIRRSDAATAKMSFNLGERVS